MSEPLYTFKNADGQDFIFGHERVDVTALRHMALSLRRRKSPDAATQALIQELVDLAATPDSGFESNQHYSHSDSVALMLARNWLAELAAPLAYDKLPLSQKHLAQSRFGRHFYSDENRAMLAGPSLPSLDPEQNLIEQDAITISALVPEGLTDDPQRAPRHPEQTISKFRDLGPRLERLCSLYDAALAEWAKVKLARPRSNPFAKPLARYQGGEWAEHEDESALRSGSFWIPAAETTRGLVFLSPNGSKMREISRGKPFDSSAEALAWGQCYGATAAIELSWSLASFISVPKAQNPTLDKIFALKESRELDQSLNASPPASEAPEEPQSPPPRRSKAAL